jgi:hypothetical protein
MKDEKGCGENYLTWELYFLDHPFLIRGFVDNF